MGHEWMKGNKFAVGQGCPPKFTDPRDVIDLINEYFEYIQGEKYEGKERLERGEEYKRRPESPTVTGLSLFLGFADKSSLYDYKKKDSFAHPIKRAVSFIEKFHELAIGKGGNCAGNIFALKNFGWKDAIDVNQNNTHDFRYSDKERKDRIKKLLGKDADS